MFYVIRLTFRKNITRWTAVSIVVIMAGSGLGALNEIIEFSASQALNDTGVGDYINNSLDLIANLVGAFLGMAYIWFREKTPSPQPAKN